MAARNFSIVFRSEASVRASVSGCCRISSSILDMKASLSALRGSIIKQWDVRTVFGRFRVGHNI
jgi:hypothetical protein